MNNHSALEIAKAAIRQRGFNPSPVVNLEHAPAGELYCVFRGWWPSIETAFLPNGEKILSVKEYWECVDPAPVAPEASGSDVAMAPDDSVRSIGVRSRSHSR